jgi:hypothetical protein
MASTDVCEVQPLQAFLSTNLNNRNKTFNDISNRILRQLGYPSNTVELHRDQIYDSISIAIEFFTKYAGYTEEILVFDSNLYERDKGLRIDKMCTIASNKAATEANINPNLFHKTYDKAIELPKRTYIATRDIPQMELPSTYDKDIKNLEVITAEQYDEITTYNASLCSFFTKSRPTDFTFNGERIDEHGQPEEFQNAFDYDLMDYRKVCEVISYDESSNRNMTSLFSFESALASQAYYTYQFSLRGFDLLSFHTLHEFLKTRRRTLALDRSFYFDPRTQYFTLLPQPKPGTSFYGIIQCRVERPIRDIIDRMWVFKYALAQCKVILGTVRGRFGSVNLAGGGVMADSLSIRAEGIKEMEVLEKELIEGSAFSEKKPAMFFVG